MDGWMERECQQNNNLTVTQPALRLQVRVEVGRVVAHAIALGPPAVAEQAAAAFAETCRPLPAAPDGGAAAAEPAAAAVGAGGAMEVDEAPAAAAAAAEEEEEVDEAPAAVAAAAASAEEEEAAAVLALSNGRETMLWVATELAAAHCCAGNPAAKATTLGLLPLVLAAHTDVDTDIRCVAVASTPMQDIALLLPPPAHWRDVACGSQHGLSSKPMNLITSDCGATRSLRIT